MFPRIFVIFMRSKCEYTFYCRRFYMVEMYFEQIILFYLASVLYFVLNLQFSSIIDNIIDLLLHKPLISPYCDNTR